MGDLAGALVFERMTPIAWNFDSPGVPYTETGNPGVNDSTIERTEERSTRTTCPSSVRTMTV
jgi:hypothetical protein